MCHSIAGFAALILVWIGIRFVRASTCCHPAAAPERAHQSSERGRPGRARPPHAPGTGLFTRGMFAHDFLGLDPEAEQPPDVVPRPPPWANKSGKTESRRARTWAIWVGRQFHGFPPVASRPTQAGQWHRGLRGIVPRSMHRRQVSQCAPAGAASAIDHPDRRERGRLPAGRCFRTLTSVAIHQIGRYPAIQIVFREATLKRSPSSIGVSRGQRTEQRHKRRDFLVAAAVVDFVQLMPAAELRADGIPQQFHPASTRSSADAPPDPRT